VERPPTCNTGVTFPCSSAVPAQRWPVDLEAVCDPTHGHVGVPWFASGEGVSPMWFYVPAAILLVLFAWGISRTHLFRHLRRGGGHGVHEPYQSSQHWEGDGGNSGFKAG
jgi:hypothetical protein